MRIRKPACFAMCVSIFLLIGNASALTNALWLAIVPPISYSNAASSQVLSDLEAASKRIDPKGRGIRIVYDKVFEPTNSLPITIHMGSASTLDVLRMVNMMTADNRRIFLIDDVALLCFQRTEGPSECRCNSIYGRLVDDVSGIVITNRVAEIRSEMEWSGDRLQFFPDGSFLASLVCDIRRPFIEGIEICIPKEEDFVNLIIRVPGYVERRLRVPLVLDYAFRPIEIRVTPLRMMKEQP